MVNKLYKKASINGKKKKRKRQLSSSSTRNNKTIMDIVSTDILLHITSFLDLKYSVRFINLNKQIILNLKQTNTRNLLFFNAFVNKYGYPICNCYQEDNNETDFLSNKPTKYHNYEAILKQRHEKLKSGYFNEKTTSLKHGTILSLKEYIQRKKLHFCSKCDCNYSAKSNVRLSNHIIKNHKQDTNSWF